MTHEELLEQIQTFGSDESYGALQLALRAVVELHKPNRPVDEYPNCEQCQDSESYYDYVPAFYPCQTIQAIERELQ